MSGLGRVLVSLLCCLGASLAATSALAASCVNSNSNGNFQVAAGARTIPRDAVVGSVVIGKIGGPPPYGVTCTGDPDKDRDAFVTFAVTAAPVPGYTDVYPTNLDGLGVKYHFATTNGTGCGLVWDQTIPNSAFTVTCHVPAGTNLWWTWGTSVEFIKTGLIAPGVLTSMPAVTMSYTLNNQSGSWPLRAQYSGALSGAVTLASCSTPDVVVAMGDYPASKLSINGIAPAKPFNILLNNCPAGMNSIRYQVDATSTVIDRANGIVALNSASAAQGVGLQLLDGAGAPHPLATQRTVAGYNQSTGGDLQVPLQARYTRTGPVTAGTANAALIFTMSYL